MNPLRPRRTLAAGLLLLSGSAASAGEWECLNKLCGHKSCIQSTKVHLPAREVEVVTEQPRVVVREMTAAREVASRAVRRSGEVVPIGTVFMPLVLPTVGFGAVGFGGVAPAPATREVVREVDEIGQFEATSRAARDAQRRQAALHEELQMAMDNHTRAASRLAVSSRVGGSSSADCAGIDKSLNELKTELKSLNDRVKSVETLLIYHDNWIKEQAVRAPATPAAGQSAFTDPPARTSPTPIPQATNTTMPPPPPPKS